MPVRALVRAAEGLGISGNALRVALTRLLAQGKLEQSSRGYYGLASGARAVQEHVAAWSRLEERMTPWRGGWVVLHVAGLPRANQRRRQRALRFLGFAELGPSLQVRPDNLTGGVAGVRFALSGLGLEPEAVVASLGELDSATESRARSLWDGRSLERQYDKLSRSLELSGARLESLPIDRALAECFSLGGRAIRQLAFDPLLPEPIVRAEPRVALVREMRAYDRKGRRVWRRFLRAERAPLIESLLELTKGEVFA